MAFTVYYDDDLECIVGYFVGELDLESTTAYAKEIVRMVTKHGCDCYLSDLRDATSGLSTAEIYDLPDGLDAVGLRHDLRRALLVRERTPDADFYETTSRNRGYQVRVFDRKDAAAAWLGARTKTSSDN